MQANQLKKAKSPFDDVSADIILQSSDHVVFRVYRLILSRASPTFENILALPHPPPDNASVEDYIDGLPVVRLEEDSSTIDIFLRCCYPVAKPEVDLSNFVAVYKAGEKYEAEVVTQHALGELNKLALQSSTCLRAYALACHMRLRPEAAAAAKQTLQLPTRALTDPTFPEMGLMSALSFAELLAYHRKCRSVVAEYCRAGYWIKCHKSEKPPMWEALEGRTAPPCCSEDDKIFFAERNTWQEVAAKQQYYDEPMPDEYDPYPAVTGYKVKTWYMNYLKAMRVAVVEGDAAIHLALRNSTALDHAVRMAYECTNCRNVAVQKLLELTEDIEGLISDSISHVALVTHF